MRAVSARANAELPFSAPSGALNMNNKHHTPTRAHAAMPTRYVADAATTRCCRVFYYAPRHAAGVMPRRAMPPTTLLMPPEAHAQMSFEMLPRERKR